MNENVNRDVLNIMDIVNLFDDYDDFNPEFKAIMLSKINALFSAILDAVNGEELDVKNTNGNYWQEEYNRIAELFQKYHN